MMSSATTVIAALFIGAIVTGCNDIGGPVPNAKRLTGGAPKFDLESEAAKVRAEAQTAQSRRGEEDYMIQIENRFPGFGGYYVDSTNSLVLLLQDPEKHDAQEIRRVLDADHATRPPGEREVWAALGPTRAERVDFSLSEIAAIHEAIRHAPLALAGKTMVSTLIGKNRVSVGFDTEEARAKGFAAVQSLGLPELAIESEVTGPVSLTGTFASTIRPTAGGPVVILVDPSVRSGGRTGGSYGFDVLTQPPYVLRSFFMMSAHVLNIWQSSNGATGQTVYQGFDPDTVGTITNNPAYSTSGCGTAPNGSAATYCTTGDVAMGTVKAGVSQAYGVAVSVSEGFNGAVGNQTINGAFAYNGVITASDVPTTRNLVHKSGYRTATTTGAVVYTGCVDLYSTLPFVGSSPWFEAECVERVNHIGVGAGDSGGPVYARLVDHGPYYALGMAVGETGTLDPSTGICNAGTSCSLYYHPFAALSMKLGYNSWGLAP